MHRAGRRKVEKALVADGRVVATGATDPPSFGTWWITLSSPEVRIVWDAKDGWLHLQVPTQDPESESWRDHTSLSDWDGAADRIVSEVRTLAAAA